MCRKFYIDLGNANHKLLDGDKQIVDCSNVEEVVAGTYGAYEVNGKHYIFGKNARSKKTTNKITLEKKALLGHTLYSVVEDKEKIDLVTLLPLSLYINDSNKQKYSELLKGKYVVENQHKVKKTFTVNNVEVYCENFSSLMTDAKLLKEPLYLVDIGGTDLSGVFVHGTPNVGKSFTNTKGMNIFFNELSKVITAHTLETYSCSDTEILYGKYDDISQDLKNVIDAFARDFIKANIYNNLVDIGYKPNIHKLVLCGGGSLALDRYLKEDSNVKILDNALWSNVQGAKILSTRKAGK